MQIGLNPPSSEEIKLNRCPATWTWPNFLRSRFGIMLRALRSRPRYAGRSTTTYTPETSRVP
jgi:hypothetical protein